MKIISGRLGELDIDPAKIITLTEGVIGFPTYKRYVFLPFMEEEAPFELFQAVDHGNLGFITVSPFLFAPEYQFELSDPDLEAIQVTSQKDVTVKVFVTIPEDPKKMTANLQGPLLINEKRLLGIQIVLNDSRWDTKHPIFPE